MNGAMVPGRVTWLSTCASCAPQASTGLQSSPELNVAAHAALTEVQARAR
jgi:hypothetical protein